MRRLGATKLDADETAVILPIQISAWFGRQVVAETTLKEVSFLFSFASVKLNFLSSTNSFYDCAKLTAF